MKKTIDHEIQAFHDAQKALIQPRLDALKADGVFVEIIASPCSHGFRDQGYAPEAVESFAKMKREYPLWGWCDVTIRLSKQLEPFGPVVAGCAHVGGCSYDDQYDFIYGSGFVDEMLEEAITALNSAINDELDSQD